MFRRCPKYFDLLQYAAFALFTSPHMICLRIITDATFFATFLHPIPLQGLRLTETPNEWT
jgi:hypothetical protein